jgi:hypothetical protein
VACAALEVSPRQETLKNVLGANFTWTDELGFFFRSTAAVSAKQAVPVKLIFVFDN